MPAAISAERWAAAHALMRGEPPTQARVAAAMGINCTTLAKQKALEGWVLLDFRRRDLLAAHRALYDRLTRRFVLGSVDAEESEPQDEPESGVDAAVGTDAEAAPAPPEASPEEQLARLGRMLSRQLDRILSAADKAGGILTKAQADTLAVTMRLAERFEVLASQSAVEKEKRSDAELAEATRRIDERIDELANERAAELVRRGFGAESAAPGGQ